MFIFLDSSNTFCWKDCPFSIDTFVEKSVDYFCVALFLDSLFCFIDLYVCLYTSNTLS